MYPGFSPVPLRPVRARPPLTSLAGPAIAVTLACVAWIAMGASYVVNTLHVDSVVDRYAAAETTRAYLDSVLHRHHVVFGAVTAANVVVIITLMIWTGLALANTDRLQPGSGGSFIAVLGWLPIANLFVPARLLARTRSVQRNAFPAKHRPRANFELIALWWLLQLGVIGLMIFDWATRHLPLLTDLHDTRVKLRVSLLVGALTMATALALLAAILMITLTNERLRKAPAITEAELPGPLAQPTPLRPTVVSNYPSSIFPTAVHPSDPRWKPTPPDEQPPGADRGYWG